jgi:ketosteroid isomerase-like protein
MVEGINAIFASWYGFPRPVVAAVNGHAIAGGLILALCADYRVGSTEGQYGVTELKAGVGYPAVAMAVVRAELHAPAARRLVLGADLVGAKEALDAGAFDEIAESDDVLRRATEVARGLSLLPREAYATVKQQLRGPVLEAALAQPDPLLEGFAGGAAPVNADLVRRSLEFTNRPAYEPTDDELADVFAPDVVLDMSARVFNPHVYEGYEGLRQFRADALEVWESLEISATELIEQGDCVLVLTRVQSRGRGSGVTLDVEGAGIWTVAGGRLTHYRLLSPGVVGRDEAIAALREQAKGRAR